MQVRASAQAVSCLEEDNCYRGRLSASLERRFHLPAENNVINYRSLVRLPSNGGIGHDAFTLRTDLAGRRNCFQSRANEYSRGLGA